VALYGIPKRRGREWLDGARVGLYALVFAVSSYIGGSHGVREIFDSLGTGFSTEHSGRVRPLCSNIRYASLYNRKVELAAGVRGENGEIGVAAVGVAVARATERRFINQAFVPALFARGDGTGRVSHAQGSYPMRYHGRFNM